MSEDRLEALEGRVAALEARHRQRSRGAALAWGGAVLAGVVMLSQAVRAQDPESPAAVEAREFILRAASGAVLFHVRPEPEGAVLELKSRDGRVTARLPWEAEMVPLANR